MRRTLTSLKHVLKILDSLILITLICSCQTVSLDSVSDEIIYPEVGSVSESELPVIDIASVDIFESDSMIIPEKVSVKEYKLQPLLTEIRVELPSVSKNITYADEVKEFDLIPGEFIVKKKVEEKSAEVITPIVKPVVIKPSLNTSSVQTVEVVKPVVKTVDKTEPETSTKIVTPTISKPVVREQTAQANTKETEKIEEPEIELLNDVDAVVNKSFTIEMDQSGWLYETEQESLVFKNKFYTNGKVLFEFVAGKSGEYNIEFSKYGNNGKSIARVKVDVVAPESVNRKIVSSKSVIVPEKIEKKMDEKARLEDAMENINSQSEPDKIYFKLAEIYYEEGFLRKSKEFYEYIYDNYPLSIYYEDAKEKMDYIINNFLMRR